MLNLNSTSRVCALLVFLTHLSLIPAYSSTSALNFTKSENYVFNPRFRSDCLLISYRDQIIFERYGRGYDATMKHGSWSLSKSIVSLLVGMAIDEGYMDLDETHWEDFFLDWMQKKAQSL